MVSVIDVKSLDLIKQIKVGMGPHGLRTDQNGKNLYVGVTQTNEIVVIDTNNLKIIDRLNVGKTPFWITVPNNS